MENEDQKAEGRILKRIAGVMGLELHHESEYVHDGTYEADRWWFMSKPFPRGYTCEGVPGWRMTMSFYTRRKLLDDILGSRTAFLDRGEVLRNPFYGMSLEEAEVRLAVMGA